MAREDYILVVDDDDAIRTSLADVLTDDGYGVRVAANGQQALEVIRSGAVPSLILLDLMMPVMDGWQFVKAAAADPALSAIPICVMTASDSLQQPSASVKAVLRKPLQLDRLFAIVERYGGLARVAILEPATGPRRAI